jgi:hypothetical protein
MMAKELSIETLANQINTAHRQAFGSAKKAMEYAAECGRLLIKAKELIPHGEWGRWLDANTEVGWRQSQKYMRLANNWEAIQAKSDSDSHLNIEAALKLLREPPEEMGKYLERTGQRIESMTSPCGTPIWHRNEDGVMVDSQTLEPIETEDQEDEEPDPKEWVQGEDGTYTKPEPRVEEAITKLPLDHLSPDRRRTAWLRMAEQAQRNATSLLDEDDNDNLAIALADPGEIDREVMTAAWDVYQAWGRVHSALAKKRASQSPSDPTPDITVDKDIPLPRGKPH